MVKAVGPGPARYRGDDTIAHVSSHVHKGQKSLAFDGGDEPSTFSAELRNLLANIFEQEEIMLEHTNLKHEYHTHINECQTELATLGIRDNVDDTYTRIISRIYGTPDEAYAYCDMIEAAWSELNDSHMVYGEDPFYKAYDMIIANLSLAHRIIFKEMQRRFSVPNPIGNEGADNAADGQDFP